SQRSTLEENPPPRDAGGAGLTSPQKGAKVCHIQRLNASGAHVHTKIDVKTARCGANSPAYWGVRFGDEPIPEPGKRWAQRPHMVRLATQDKALRSRNTRSRSCVSLTGGGFIAHRNVHQQNSCRLSIGGAAADGVVEVTRSSAPAGGTARRAHNVKVDR